MAYKVVLENEYGECCGFEIVSDESDYYDGDDYDDGDEYDDDDGDDEAESYDYSDDDNGDYLAFR